MKVLLLSGGSSDEKEVSKRSGQAIARALRQLNYEFVEADPDVADFDLKSLVHGIDVVFLALHGAGGEDGTLQEELENLGVPFTGSDSKASALCIDKTAYKELLASHDFPLARGRLVSKADIDDELFYSPYVLKPFNGGSSLDTQIVRTADDQARHKSLELLDKYPKMLLEELIEGTEITIGIFDQEALPVIEIVPPEGLEFDYENKYNGATQELCPPVSVSEETQRQAKDLALRIHRLTGCRHMSRTDMIVDKTSKLFVLETNTIPGLTDQSLLPKMMVTAGYTMPQFVDKLLHLALSPAA